MSQATESPSFPRVIEEFEVVFPQQGVETPALVPETVLDGSLGLESLDFAELVVRLEQVFRKGPFSSDTIPEVRNRRRSLRPLLRSTDGRSSPIHRRILGPRRPRRHPGFSRLHRRTCLHNPRLF